MACLFGHKWSGCKCMRCGRINDTGHHWNGCKCTACGKLRNEEHQLAQEGEFLVCAVCGEKREHRPSGERYAADIPILQKGLQIRPVISVCDKTNTFNITGAHVLYNGVKVFSVNEVGKKLLGMADGITSIDEMIEKLDVQENAFEVAMFFVKLGQAGYLENKIEVKLYESQTFVEGHYETGDLFFTI